MSPQLRKSIQKFLVDVDNPTNDLGREAYLYNSLQTALNFLRMAVVEDYKIPEYAILDNCYDEDHDDEYNQKVAEEISNKYNIHIANLKNTFEKKTGLTLYFDTYDEEGGDRYDNPNDKDGIIFCVDGMVQLTPAGEKYKDIITEHRWTQFG